MTKGIATSHMVMSHRPSAENFGFNVCRYLYLRVHMPAAGLLSTWHEMLQAVMSCLAHADCTVLPNAEGARCSEQGVHSAELLRVLAMAVDTRKVPMVEAAVDLVQKLIAHQFLVGPVYSISQKGDSAARKPAKRRVTGDEDDEMEAASGDVLPHQVHHGPGRKHVGHCSPIKGLCEILRLQGV